MDFTIIKIQKFMTNTIHGAIVGKLAVLLLIVVPHVNGKNSALKCAHF